MRTRVAVAIAVLLLFVAGFVAWSSRREDASIANSESALRSDAGTPVVDAEPDGAIARRSAESDETAVAAPPLPATHRDEAGVFEFWLDIRDADTGARLSEARFQDRDRRVALTPEANGLSRIVTDLPWTDGFVGAAFHATARVHLRIGQAARPDDAMVVRLRSGVGIEARVVDEDGTPVRGARIELRRFGPGELVDPPVITDEDGRFHTAVPTHLQAAMLVLHPDFVTLEAQDVSYVVSRAPRVLPDMVLHRGRWLEGRIVDGDDRGIAGATVTEIRLGARTATSDDDGTFRFGPVDAAATVVVTAPGFVVTKATSAKAEPCLVRMRPLESVTGRVVDSLDRPLAGWQVSAIYLERGYGVDREHAMREDEADFVTGRGERPPTPTTDADGRFRIDRLVPGEWRLEAKCDAVGHSIRGRGVTGGADALLREDPKSRSIRVRGRIVSALDGRAVPRSTVSVTTPDGTSDRLLARADASGGSFDVWFEFAGEVRLDVNATGFRPWSNTIAVGSTGVDALLVALDPGASIEGCLRDHDGRPLADTRVSFEMGPKDGELWEASTDSRGRYAIDGLPAGEYAVAAGGEIVAPGAAPAWVSMHVEPARVALAANERRVVELTTPAPRGRVRLQVDGLVPPDAYDHQVLATLTGPDGESARIVVDAGEPLVFPSIAAGHHALKIVLQGIMEPTRGRGGATYRNSRYRVSLDPAAIDVPPVPESTITLRATLEPTKP